MANKMLVTIGRQLGSGGYEVGIRLAKKLGISFYAKELLEMASKESGLNRRFYERADEQPAGNFIGGFFGGQLPFATEGLCFGNNCLGHDALFKDQSDVIRAISKKESALFMGRCADYILRKEPNLIKIFIYSPIELRIKRLRNSDRLEDPDHAENLIQKADKSRAAYYDFYTNNEWGKASSYDICIDSSKMTSDELVEFLYNYCMLRMIDK